MHGQYAFEHGDKMIISIDGAAGTGKTTVGKIVANEINYQFLDSGKIYRAYTNLDDTTLSKILSQDIYMDASTCKKYGLVDKIME